MENVRYQFEFEISEKDYRDFTIYVHDAQIKRSKWVSGVIFILAFLLMFFVRGSLLSYFILLSLAVALILSFSGVLMRWLVNISIRRMKKEGKLPYENKNLLQFQDDFIFGIADGTETRVPYTKIEKVKLHKEVMYIFISVLQAYIIPLSIFETVEQQNEFLTFIKHKSGLS